MGRRRGARGGEEVYVVAFAHAYLATRALYLYLITRMTVTIRAPHCFKHTLFCALKHNRDAAGGGQTWRSPSLIGRINGRNARRYALAIERGFNGVGEQSLVHRRPKQRRDAASKYSSEHS